jgi:hypothetical protein
MIKQMRAMVDSGVLAEAEAEAMIQGSLRPARMDKWPTPRKSTIAASASMDVVGNIKNPRGNLEEVIYQTLYPTPTKHNAKERDYPAEATLNTPTLTHFVCAGQQTPQMYLNPTWVEWLMGWPTGWTDLQPLETGKFQEWQQQHGGY